MALYPQENSGRFPPTQDKVENAKRSLIQASTLCGDNVELLAKIFKKVPSDMITNDLEVVKFLLDMEIYNGAEALKFGLQLLNDGAKDHRIFEQVLIRSMRLKRRAEFIEDIARDAIKHCPEHETSFTRFIRKSA